MCGVAQQGGIDRHYKIGNDIGGTFTDTILLDSRTGELFVGKVLTAYPNPQSSVVRGVASLLQDVGADAGLLQNLIHGTTLVSNALIERKGAKTALITTRGFRDILESRNEKRYDLYDIFVQLPEPIVPRQLRTEVTERLDETGAVLVDLDLEEAEATAKWLAERGVEAIAVCFLHSFRNPAHERAVEDVISRVAPHIRVSLSSDVVPQIREFQRASTTVANAFAQPLMMSYVTGMERDLRELGYTQPIHVMLSNGGITTSDVAGRFPIRVVESGPAAGAIAASFYGGLLGLDKLVSFDMGGTTAKICLIDGDRPATTTDFEVARVHRFKKGSGLPIKTPVIDMIEIGAGGGSIAHINDMGLLQVGPHSAASDPGPACYDRGGKLPTVTDADLVLGYLDADYFLGGKMALSLDNAVQSIRTHVADPLSISVEEAAWGIYQAVNENMVSAARVYLAEKGEDARHRTLVGFGGAGPVHAFRLAARLGVDRVVIPVAAGVTSALGFLAAPFSFDFVRTYMTPLEDIDFSQVNRLLAEMEAQGERLLIGAGVAREEIQFHRSCEMRYVGQGHEIEVEIPSGELGSQHVDGIREAFDGEYGRLYFTTNRGYRVECLNWRVVASSPKPLITLRKHPATNGARIEDALRGTRRAYFPEVGGFVECPVYDRYRLFEGSILEGPAVVEERESTTLLGPGARAVADAYLNLIIELRGK